MYTHADPAGSHGIYSVSALFQRSCSDTQAQKEGKRRRRCSNAAATIVFAMHADGSGQILMLGDD